MIGVILACMHSFHTFYPDDNLEYVSPRLLNNEMALFRFNFLLQANHRQNIKVARAIAKLYPNNRMLKQYYLIVISY